MRELLYFCIPLEFIKYWKKIINFDNLGMYKTPRITTKITMQN